MSAEVFDIKAVRARLAEAGGPQFWRSLDSVAETPEFQAFVHREFPAAPPSLTTRWGGVASSS